MKKTLTVIAVTVLSVGAVAGTASAGQGQSDNAAKSLGKTTIDTDVYDADGGEMLYGDGIPNGEWMTAEVQGVVLGLRATDRTDGTLDVSGEKGNRVGVYSASTGLEVDDVLDSRDRAEWNYEWSVDLRNATGNAEGRTIEDYSLSLEQDFAPLFGTFSLTMPLVCDATDADGTLCQQSWNPNFFGAASFGGYDASAETSYNLRLVLTPETFNGPPLAVTIEVVVSAP